MSLYKRPHHRPHYRIADPEEPVLRPVQVHVRRLRFENPQGVKCVVRGPFAGKRFNGAVPDQALRMGLTHRQELALEVRFSDLEGGGQMNVIRGDFKLHKPLSTNHPPPHHRHSGADKASEGVQDQIRDLEEADAKEQLEALNAQ